jgi:small neutral amino acid transporter SnatA (MarC family)
LLVCAVAAVGMVAGFALAIPALAIAGGVVCGISCLAMIAGMIRGSHHHGRATGV